MTKPKHEVSVQLGFTVQPRQYESIRYDLKLSLEGKPDETPDQTFDKVQRWVEARVQEKLTELADHE